MMGHRLYLKQVDIGFNRPLFELVCDGSCGGYGGDYNCEVWFDGERASYDEFIVGEFRVAEAVRDEWVYWGVSVCWVGEDDDAEFFVFEDAYFELCRCGYPVRKGGKCHTQFCVNSVFNKRRHGAADS